MSVNFNLRISIINEAILVKNLKFSQIFLKIRRIFKMAVDRLF